MSRSGRASKRYLHAHKPSKDNPSFFDSVYEFFDAALHDTVDSRAAFPDCVATSLATRNPREGMHVAEPSEVLSIVNGSGEKLLTFFDDGSKQYDPCHAPYLWRIRLGGCDAGWELTEVGIEVMSSLMNVPEYNCAPPDDTIEYCI